MEDKSSERHAHARKHMHIGIATWFVMFTAGGTDAYGLRPHICCFKEKLL